MKVEVDFEFRCPQCGGSWFTSNLVEGQCSGTGDRDRHYPCSFTWKRADDFQVFILVHRTSFDTREEYETAKTTWENV